MRIIIAGSRTFRDKNLLYSFSDSVLKNINKEDIIILNGCQVSYDEETEERYGADYFADLYLKDRGYTPDYYPAAWKTLGKKAGPIRNLKMGENAQALILYWDLQTPGSRGMLKIAIEKELMIRVCNCDLTSVNYGKIVKNYEEYL